MEIVPSKMQAAINLLLSRLHKGQTLVCPLLFFLIFMKTISQIPPDLVVKSQLADIIGIIL